MNKFKQVHVVEVPMCRGEGPHVVEEGECVYWQASSWPSTKDLLVQKVLNIFVCKPFIRTCTQKISAKIAFTNCERDLRI